MLNSTVFYKIFITIYIDLEKYMLTTNVMIEKCIGAFYLNEDIGESFHLF